MWGRAKKAALVALVTALLVPAGAHGTVTIGSNLATAPTSGIGGCGIALCTFAQNGLPASQQAAGGVTSPVNGNVVLWRIATTGGTQYPVAFRVVRRLSTGSIYTGVATSTTVTPPPSSTTPYPTQLPIKAGDLIGINCCQSPSNYFGSAAPEAMAMLRWGPALADGDPGRSPNGGGNLEITVNADIEPTSAFTIGAIKPGKGGKLTVTATLPNPGTLKGGDKSEASLAAAAGKKKPKYLQRATAPVGVANQTIRILLKPTKAARSVLAEKGKLKTKAKLVFTPTGGNPSTQIIKAKLKR
jgi:hypothetical protein